MTTSSPSLAAAPTSEALAAEYARLDTRRTALQERLAGVSARAAELTAQRTEHLVAGRDAQAAKLATGIREVRDDEAALTEAVSALEREIAALAARQQAQAQAEERAAAQVAFGEASLHFYATRNAALTDLRDMMEAMRQWFEVVRAAHQAAGAARERLNRATGETVNWDGNLWAFEHYQDGEMIRVLADRAGKATAAR